MNIVLSWLRDFIEIEQPPEKIANALLMAGLEVESIQQPGKGLSKVVVGRIMTRDPHPNADKLVVCQVEVGKGDPLTIVCGAANGMPGEKVPVALVGATLPSGFQIGRAKIRGLESFGMLCSKRELGISEDHGGLMILPEDAPIGNDIVEYLGLHDVVFDVSITPNRGDALSHLGVARELSAIFNLPLLREALPGDDGAGNASDFTSVTIDDKLLCPRYGARVVRNISVGPSPRWLRDRLEKAGVRSINNVVDIGNYVMLHIGHPMHAFDFDRLAEQRIVVRRARAGELLRTLDGTERKLDTSNLVIADADKPVALAGVMGGLDTSVTQQTTTVLLEAACFDPISIRKTSKALAMMSDSSYRFERGVNIDNIPIALNLAADLLRQYASGEPVGGIVDAYPNREPLPRIQLRTRRVSRVLGIDLTPQQIETLLLRLKLEVKREGDTLWVGVPPYRHDLEEEIDLIEEVARIYGYNQIPESLLAISAAPVLPSRLQYLETRLRDHFVSLGFHEIITFSFISCHTAEAFHEKKPISLCNPLSEEQGILRTGLLPCMFEALRSNILADELHLKFLEIGKVFHPVSGTASMERTRLCLGLSGASVITNWKRSQEPVDLYLLKGLVEGIGVLAGQRLTFLPGSREVFHPANQLEIAIGKKSIGHLGQINPQFLDNKKMPRNIFLAEIDLDDLASAAASTTKMKAISEFPPLRRDLAVLVPLTVRHRQLETVIQEEGKELLEDVRLFDVYQGKGIPEQHQSMAFSLTFRHPERTLKDEEVQPLFDAMVRRISTTLQGKLR